MFPIPLQMSVFLVGLLSVSRLLLLRYPSITLPPRSAFIVPLANLTLCTVVLVGLLASEVMYTAYIPGKSSSAKLLSMSLTT